MRTRDWMLKFISKINIKGKLLNFLVPNFYKIHVRLMVSRASNACTCLSNPFCGSFRHCIVMCATFVHTTVNSPPVLYSQFISRAVPLKHNSGLDAVSS